MNVRRIFVAMSLEILMKKRTAIANQKRLRADKSRSKRFNRTEQQ